MWNKAGVILQTRIEPHDLSIQTCTHLKHLKAIYWTCHLPEKSQMRIWPPLLSSKISWTSSKMFLCTVFAIRRARHHFFTLSSKDYHIFVFILYVALKHHTTISYFFSDQVRFLVESSLREDDGKDSVRSTARLIHIRRCNCPVCKHQGLNWKYISFI